MSRYGLKALADVCLTITDGSHYSPSTLAEGFPYITVRDLDDGIIDFVGCKRVAASDYSDLKRNGCAPRRGDVLFSKDGTVGKVALVDTDEEFVVLSSLAILRPDPSKIDSRFLSYSLQTPAFLAEALGLKTGVAIRRVILKNLKSILVPLPPLEEQQRIVAALDKAFAAISTATANAEKNLANARDLLQAGLDNTFEEATDGAPAKQLSEHLTLVTYGFTNPMPTTDEGPFMVTAKNVRNGRIDYASARFTSRDAFKNLLTDKSRPKVGDVLLTKDGTLGRVAVVDRPGICINQSVALLRPGPSIEPHFLKCLLMTTKYQEKMAHDAGGTTIKHIYITRVDKMAVGIPDLDTQCAAVQKLEALAHACGRLESSVEAKLSTLEALKQSLLYRAFSGELTEREPLAA